jgi:tetratricopeptide (TPR) repeat protein
LLCELAGGGPATIAWLERATQLEPDDYWTEFYLGFYHERSGHDQRALARYQAAVALRKDSPWAWYNRALLERAQGDWEQSLVDLDRALSLSQSQGFDFVEARLNRGIVLAGLGDAAGARAAYESVIAAASGSPFLARAARLNRAQLDFESGAVAEARAEYDALLVEAPRDAQARLSRALLALRCGDPSRAETELTLLLRDDPNRAAEIFARRALARLSLQRPLDAEADAANAYRRKPGPSSERLWIRTLLALGRIEDLLWLKSPDDLAVLPGGEQALRQDLRQAAERLRVLAEAEGHRPAEAPAPVLIHRTRAVILAALDDPAALAEASRAVSLAPESDGSYLVRARVRRHFGDRTGALADVEAGLVHEPADPRLLELQGLLETETGHPGAALVVLNRAVVRGASARVHAPKALALMALGRNEEAVEQWSLALTDDPEDPRLYLGRARALIRLRHWARALADLEQADDWVGDRPALLTRITLVTATCLPARPDRLAQWLTRARRTIAALASAGR